ncbi:transcriptional regulator FilR1 domain-containing protein [Halobaculum gomorrense]|uniref:Predicted transcriptional regulator, contains HTH domain n=1 Tax=Halobaculum gomorrense TaxID=43928 RepID=A0A1M5KWW1_9EURY|nr:hypothetical protein [Halobaculum gomorrense]SHG56999.1 Predicted transcriptional regulator, contains HTH domain [Halobaculum gomorrense]
MDSDLVSLALERRTYLELAASSPRWKRDFVDELSDSRSTVNRVIPDLVDADLLEQSSRGYRLTYTGRVLLESVQEITAIGDTVGETEGLLNNLPDSAPVNPRLFVDADILTTDVPSVTALTQEPREQILSADRVRAIGLADNDPKMIEGFYDRVTGEDEFILELIAEDSLARHLLETYGDLLDETLQMESLSISSTDSVPFGFYLTFSDSERRELIMPIHDDQRILRGMIRTKNERALEWADKLYEEVQSDAIPLREIAERRSDWLGHSAE